MSKSDYFFILLACFTGFLCYLINGLDSLYLAFSYALNLLIFILPVLAGGLLIGGLIQQFIDQDKITKILGEKSGFSGLIFATLAGVITPGGPFTSFPIVFALWVAGADIGALVAYIAAWSLIGVYRLVIWEIPMMGLDLSILRFLVSIPLPLIAGLAARRLVQLIPLNYRGASNKNEQ